MGDSDHRPPPQEQPLHQPHPPPQDQPLYRPYPPSQARPKPMHKPMAPNYGLEEPNRRAFCTCIATVCLLVGLLIFVLWLVYRPTKPHFLVVGAALYGLNSTTAPAPLISASMQFTIIIRNPNRRDAIYFDTLSTFVSYRNQPITPQVALPPLYMEERSSVSLSPMIGGAPVPVSPDVSNGLATDEAYGVVDMKLIFQGRLRWKAGAVRTARYGIYVNCDLMMGLKKGFSGQVPLVGAPVCNVDM